MKKILFFDIKKAFTVAEILITLGIIGIIAVTIIPIILNEYNNEIFAVQLKRALNVTNAAIRGAAYENGGSLDGYDLGRNLGKYLKLSKNCILLTDTYEDYSCWHDTNIVKQKKTAGAGGGFSYVLPKTYKSVVTIDGMFIRFYDPPNGCYGEFNCNKGNVTDVNNCYIRKNVAGYCGDAHVDINGLKGPNIVGEDIRRVHVWSDGFVGFQGVSDKGSRSIRFTNSKTSEGQMHPEWYQSGGKCYDGLDYAAATDYD